MFPTYLQQGEIALVYPQRFLSLIEAYALAASRFDVTGLAGARRALLEYTALLDMPAEYFLDTVDIVFQRMSLALGTWDVGGRRVEPAAARHRPADRRRRVRQGHGRRPDMRRSTCSSLADDERFRIDIDDCDHYRLLRGTLARDVHPMLQRVFAWAEARRPRPRRIRRT